MPPTRKAPQRDDHHCRSSSATIAHQADAFTKESTSTTITTAAAAATIAHQADASDKEKYQHDDHHCIPQYQPWPMNQ
jgi:hypothetical protein